MSERQLTAAAVARVLAGDDAWDAVARALKSKELDNDGRARVAKRVYGVCVMRMRLEYLAQSAAAEALLDMYIADVEGTEGARREWPADPIERICVERSCPRALVDELVRSLGNAGADAFLAVSNEPGPRVLRANTLKTSRDALARALADENIKTTPGKLSPDALFVDGPANLFGSQAWRGGLFEVQDEGSQLVARACAPQPGEIFVDLCAGRGGKTLALAALAGNHHAKLHVHDVDERALADMRSRLKRSGAKEIVESLPEPGTADVVLVDAPCSALGTLRRSPMLRWQFSRERADEFPPLQRSLVQQARALLKPTGRLVYATCTVRKEENDDVLPGGRLLLPHVDGTDGFYIAREPL